jgi:AmiR/NasT family two-component response regulator/two-component sensor histidine kinase
MGQSFWLALSITGVRDVQGETTHYVGNFVDVTGIRHQEEQRLRNEAALRSLLVREVHHRIKNNLQGIVGVLGQFAKHHPLISDPINDAISQVQSIAVIHGLQGRIGNTKVRLCELTAAIKEQVESLWNATVDLCIPVEWTHCVIAEREAVPIALVLNELITNAVKHRSTPTGSVQVALGVGAMPASVCILITNPGELVGPHPPARRGHAGLALVDALLPRSGASLTVEQHLDNVMTRLELGAPRHCDGAPRQCDGTQRNNDGVCMSPEAAPRFGRRLLLVDDDRLVLSTLSQGLRGVGYEVDTAESAEDADAWLAGGGRPDLAILDIRMSGRDGLYLARRLHDLDHVPFMMLSAYGEPDMVKEAAAVGALGYSVKPVSMVQLVPAIEAALARAEELSDLRETRQQLQRALDAERSIAVATGIVMVEYRVGRKEAFALLRETARKRRHKLADVANAIVQAQEALSVGAARRTLDANASGGGLGR